MQTLETFAPSATADHLSDADITAAIGLFFLTKKGGSAHLFDVAVLVGNGRKQAARHAGAAGIRNGANYSLLSTASGL